MTIKLESYTIESSEALVPWNVYDVSIPEIEIDFDFGIFYACYYKGILSKALPGFPISTPLLPSCIKGILEYNFPYNRFRVSILSLAYQLNMFLVGICQSVISIKA